MYFVYWKYVERAREFVNNKGNFTIKEGSDANLIPKLMKDVWRSSFICIQRIIKRAN